MKENQQDIIAPEQYELQNPPAYRFSMNRRTFFQALGSGLTVTFTVSQGLASSFSDTPPEDQLSSWIHVGANGKVTVYTGKAEVGQNIRTSLAQIVAEELNVPMENIEMVMGDTALTPYDRGTFGSRSIPYMGPQLRKAAATAREVLIDMAASELKVDRETLYAEEGIVKSRSGNKSLAFAQLTKGKEFIQPVKENIKTKPVEQWKIAGTSVPKVNGISFITGKHKYTSDMKLPGMLYGKVLRAPAYGAKLLSVDLSKAKGIPGVTVV